MNQDFALNENSSVVVLKEADFYLVLVWNRKYEAYIKEFELALRTLLEKLKLRERDKRFLKGKV